MDIFLTIILLYADDTVLVSDDPIKLPRISVHYCNKWKLEINTNKTK